MRAGSRVGGVVRDSRPLHRHPLERRDVRQSGDTDHAPGRTATGAVTVAFLWCDRCLPPWQISYLPIDLAPWSAVDRRTGNRFRCPDCGCAVRGHIDGPTWQPFAS